MSTVVEHSWDHRGMKSSIWAEFRAHRIDKHLAWHGEDIPEERAA